MKPVKDMLCKRIEALGHIAERIAPIGEKGDGLVHLHPLALQDFKQSSLGLGIVARDQPKTGRGSFSCRAFAHNHFKRAIFALLRRARVNVATIEADGQRCTRFGQFVPLRRTPLDKGRLFVAQFLFEALSYLMDMTRDRGGAQLMLHRQEVREESDGHAIRQERGPPDFLAEQFRCAPFGEQCSDRTPTPFLLRLARAGIQSRAREGEFAEERPHTDLMVALAGEWMLTVWTLALLLHVVFDLLRRHDLLGRSQHLFRFAESQTERLWR